MAVETVAGGKASGTYACNPFDGSCWDGMLELEARNRGAAKDATGLCPIKGDRRWVEMCKGWAARDEMGVLDLPPSGGKCHGDVGDRLARSI